jgi:cellulose synthase (UDP-forming)
MQSATTSLTRLRYHLSTRKVTRTNRIVRLASVVYTLTVLWNMAWVAANLQFGSVPQDILTISFVVATGLISTYAVLHVINSWQFKSVEPRRFTGSEPPEAAIIIPTYGESVQIVSRTVRSVLQQRWPIEKMIVVVSDDGQSDRLQAIIEGSQTSTAARLHYFRPPPKGDPARKGESKAGNLNAALDYVSECYPHVQYIETRDADDLVADQDFLSFCIEYLETHQRTSFVQTIKQCQVSRGDPFSNQESLFYQRTMPAKFAANAVFPCGSGLVWRRTELERIDGFPSWNLVEDLQSGYEVLRRGGQGAFLPIVGALGQIAPEDIPNFYKQRGTWALDTLRLFYYRNPLFTRGLSFMQKLHFLELEFSYVLSFAMAIFVVQILLGLNAGTSPLSSTGFSYFMHLSVLAMALEVHAVARARGVSYREQWVARQIWLGLMPVFIISTIRALWYGPHRKPTYKVTRKYHKVGWYWRETLPQTLIVVLLLASVGRSFLYQQGPLLFALGLQFWGLFFAYGFWRVVRNGWHNYRLRLRRMFLQRKRVYEETVV